MHSAPSDGRKGISRTRAIRNVRRRRIQSEDLYEVLQEIVGADFRRIRFKHQNSYSGAFFVPFTEKNGEKQRISENVGEYRRTVFSNRSYRFVDVVPLHCRKEKAVFETLSRKPLALGRVRTSSTLHSLMRSLTY